MSFIQPLKRTVKIVHSNVLNFIAIRKITHIYYTQKIVNGKIIFTFQEAKPEANPKDSIELHRYKKEFLKFRTPSLLRRFIGKNINVYKDYLSDDPDEIFRIEPIDFNIIEHSANERLKNPVLTKTGICIIPAYYVNSYLDERISGMRINFNETSLQILEQGAAAAYVTDKDTRLSYPLYKYEHGLKTRTMESLNEFFNEAGKQLCLFKYQRTIFYDGYHKFGTIIFEEQK